MIRSSTFGLAAPYPHPCGPMVVKSSPLKISTLLSRLVKGRWLAMKIRRRDVDLHADDIDVDDSGALVKTHVIRCWSLRMAQHCGLARVARCDHTPGHLGNHHGPDRWEELKDLAPSPIRLQNKPIILFSCLLLIWPLYLLYVSRRRPLSIAFAAHRSSRKKITTSLSYLQQEMSTDCPILVDPLNSEVSAAAKAWLTRSLSNKNRGQTSSKTAGSVVLTTEYLRMVQNCSSGGGWKRQSKGKRKGKKHASA